jgi:nitrogen fixation protein
MATLMSFADAAQRQHLYGSYYTVWLVAPDGTREYLAYTSRKTGDGLLAVLRYDRIQERVKLFPDAASITLKKKGGALVLSNGWRIAFGGTIRQEASAAAWVNPS